MLVGLKIGELFYTVAGENQAIDGPGCQDCGGITNEVVSGNADIGMYGGLRGLVVFGCDRNGIIGGENVVAALAE